MSKICSEETLVATHWRPEWCTRESRYLPVLSVLETGAEELVARMFATHQTRISTAAGVVFQAAHMAVQVHARSE